MSQDETSPLCCVECFAADEPQDEIIRRREVGDCSFCGAAGVQVCPAEDLYDLFAPLLQYFEIVEYGNHYLDPNSDPTRHGGPLAWVLQEHWRIFSERLLREGGLEELVAAILTGHDTKDLWTTIDERWYADPEEDDGLWERLAEHVKTERRFVLDSRKSEFAELKDRLELVIEDTTWDLLRGSHVYRSRVGVRLDGEYLLARSKAEMGAPDPSPTVSGRANPPGIAYLYVATDKETAVAEQRLGVGAHISVATMRVRRDIRLADISEVRGLESPFGVEHLEWAIRSRALLRALGEELSRPVTRGDSPLEYVPSQLLCELILDLGYDGVAYPSGYGSGRNIVIFDPTAATPICVEIATVVESKIEIDFHEELFAE